MSKILRQDLCVYLIFWKYVGKKEVQSGLDVPLLVFTTAKQLPPNLLVAFQTLPFRSYNLFFRSFGSALKIC